MNKCVSDISRITKNDGYPRMTRTKIAGRGTWWIGGVKRGWSQEKLGRFERNKMVGADTKASSCGWKELWCCQQAKAVSWLPPTHTPPSTLKYANIFTDLPDKVCHYLKLCTLNHNKCKKKNPPQRWMLIMIQISVPEILMQSLGHQLWLCTFNQL